MSDFEKRSCRLTVTAGGDTLEVRKSNDSDWTFIRLSIDERELGSFRLRSEEMARALYYALGRVLGKAD